MRSRLWRRDFLAGLTASVFAAPRVARADAVEESSGVFHEAEILRHLGALRFLARFVSEGGRALSAAEFGIIPARRLLPEAWPRYDDQPAAPWGAAVEAAVSARLEGVRVRLAEREWREVAEDRFGHRALSFMEADADIEINRLLIAEGLAVASARDAGFRGARSGRLRDEEARLLREDAGVFARDFAAEEEARAMRRGVWGNGLRVLMPETASGYTARWRGFGIIRGVPLSHQERSTLDWLNFGHDPRTDFTLAIPRILRTRVEELLGEEISGFPGRGLEMRGWVEWRGGPYVVLSAPHRLRLLV